MTKTELLEQSGIYNVHTVSTHDIDHNIKIKAISAEDAERAALGTDFGYGFPDDAVATLVKQGLSAADFTHDDPLEEYLEFYGVEEDE